MCYVRVVPRFEPFAGLRYDRSVPLDKVIAPPYDVVGPAERATLAARHRANAIHVELPVDDPGSGLDRYRSAAHLLAAWIDEGLVQRDAAPVFYAYRMTMPGGPATTGVFGALGCEPVGGDILPHEQTIPKDKSDRLDLLRATRTNLSPIWGLSLTPGLAKFYEPSGAPHASAIDDDGVMHELWVIDDPEAIEAIAAGVAASPLVIADGHHRYETALTYRDERRQENGNEAGDYDSVLAFVVELAEDQVSVGPIHRTLHGLGDSDVSEIFSRWYDMVLVGPPDEDVMAPVAESQALALITPDNVWLLTPRQESIEAAASDLDSSLLAMVLATTAGASAQYHHDWRTIVASVRSGEADAGVLIRPVTVQQIGEWAHARRRMPPKSTFFRPKLRTGMVFRPLDS